MTAPHVGRGGSVARARLQAHPDSPTGSGATPSARRHRRRHEGRRRSREDTLDHLRGRRAWTSVGAASVGSNGLFASAYHIKAAVWSREEGAGQSEGEEALALPAATGRHPINRDRSARGRSRRPPVGRRGRLQTASGIAWSMHEGLATKLLNHLEQDFTTTRRRPEWRRRAPEGEWTMLVPFGASERAGSPPRLKSSSRR